MRSLFSFLFGTFGLVILVAISLGWAYIFPYPFSKLNLILGSLILLLLWGGSGKIVWLSFFTHFIVELFSASPFGVILFSSTIAMLLSFWLFQNFFTNRSWYSAVILTGVTIFFFRFFYIISLLIFKILGLTTFIPWNLILLTFFWEELLTIISVSVFYAILANFSKKLKNDKLKKKIFWYAK